MRSHSWPFWQTPSSVLTVICEWINYHDYLKILNKKFIIQYIFISTISQINGKIFANGASVLAQPFNTMSLDKMWQLIPIFTFSYIFKDAKKFLRLRIHAFYTKFNIFFKSEWVPKKYRRGESKGPSGGLKLP